MEQVRQVIRSYPEVYGYHTLRARQAGSKILLDVRITLDPATSLQKTHKLSHNLSNEIKQRVPQVVDIVIHAEPHVPGHTYPGSDQHGLMAVVERHCLQPGNIPVLVRHIPDGHRKPAVIILLGGGRGYHKDWAMKVFPMDGAPFVRVYPDMPQHGGRGDPSGMMRRWNADPVGGFIAPIIIGMRKDLSLVIDYLQGREDVDPERIGACGWSIGGMSVILALPRDKRIKVAVAIAPAQSPRRLLYTDMRGKEQWPIVTPPTAEQLEWLSREEDPEVWAQHFYPTAFLLLHGTHDQRVPAAASRLLYQALAPHYRQDPGRLSLVEYPAAGHRPTPEMAAATMEWFERFLL